MLRNVRQPKPKKPVIAMLHGSGSSSTIFSIQTHLLAKELSKKYNLVFLDGPIPSAPGPGVLPLFADMPGYYRWVPPGLPPSLRLAELLEVERCIREQLDDRDIKPSEVVAFLGFSQGALISLAMHALKLVDGSVWENLRFSVAIAASTTGNVAQIDEMEKIMGMLSRALGREDGKFPGYTVHASGIRDLWYKDGRRVASMCARDRTKTMDFRDGHVVPRQKAEVMKLVQLINGTDEASQAAAPTVGPIAPLSELVPSILAGEDCENNFAGVSAHAISARL